MDRFRPWLEAKKPLTPPKGLLGQAVAYTLSNWDKLVVYLEDGRLKPDNNAAENALRPFVLGRAVIQKVNQRKFNKNMVFPVSCAFKIRQSLQFIVRCGFKQRLSFAKCNYDQI